MLTMEMVLHKEVDFAPKFGKSRKMCILLSLSGSCWEMN